LCFLPSLCEGLESLKYIASLWEKVGITFTLLKKEFPPSFFDMMTHLLLHVVDELEVCGLVHKRCMCLVE
jgi:hypothetical protein